MLVSEKVPHVIEDLSQKINKLLTKGKNSEHPVILSGCFNGKTESVRHVYKKSVGRFGNYAERCMGRFALTATLRKVP